MAYSINWATKVITIPKADTVLVSSSPDVRSLDISTLWATLISIEDSEEAISFPTIVRNTAPLTVAGLTLARVIEIINGYTITFEDGLYAVNIIGGNCNLADVVNKNMVSVNTSNSAGLVQVTGDTASNIAVAVMASLIETGMSLKDCMRYISAATAGKISGAAGTTIVIRSAYSDTKDRIIATVDADGNRTAITYDNSD